MCVCERVTLLVVAVVVSSDYSVCNNLFISFFLFFVTCIGDRLNVVVVVVSMENSSSSNSLAQPAGGTPAVAPPRLAPVSGVLSQVHIQTCMH
jgi:hypothetical protein